MTNPLFDALFGDHLGKGTPFLHLPGGETLTHDAFLKLAAQYANTLTDAGLTPGDRVAAQVEKSHHALAVYAACVQAGLVFLPLNTGYTVEELSYFIEDSGAAMVICKGDRRDALSPIAAEHGAALETLDDDGSGSLSKKAADAAGTFDTVERSEEDLAALLYTSGTTGRSKGAMLSQGNLLSNAETLAEHWRFTADDVLLHALPIFHTHGLFVATNITLVAGGAMIFLP
ncbi:MAG: AMP-binding protein, partial [Roseovarius sp.]